jgi:predicted amidophosphoribosyltransferase
MSRRSSFSRRFNEPELCLACRDRVEPWMRLCDGCWRLLPPARRRAIADARQTGAKHVISQRFRQAAEWLRANTPAVLADRRIEGRAVSDGAR